MLPKRLSLSRQDLFGIALHLKRCMAIVAFSCWVFASFSGYIFAQGEVEQMLNHKCPLPMPTNNSVKATTKPTLEDALKSKRDLFGELAMTMPDDAKYDFFASLLPPLRYVNALFRYYPIVLSAPFSEVKARFISNGSAVNARANLRTWREVGTPVKFFVGDGEAFGEDLHRLDEPRYLHGYLPIVQLRYRCANATYEQEAFVAVDAPFSEHGAVFVRFAVADGKGKVIAQTEQEVQLTVSNGTLRNGNGHAIIWFDEQWHWDASTRTLSASLTNKRNATMVIFTKPLTSSLGRLTYDLYERQRHQCEKTWNDLLKQGMAIQTPEGIVNDAWRALIIGIFLLAKGSMLCYSAGNAYERQYEAECGDAVRALLLYGFEEKAREMIVPLLDYRQQGLSFHDAAFKLQLLSHYFWLTHDAQFIREQRERWEREIRLIVESREPETGLLPRENYCGDIATQVYSLNSNANAWRGLRDMAAVLDEMGEHDEAQRLMRVAHEFRKSILDAVAKSERLDVSPPFIPIALFGEEKPYETLTATRMGSYWCLMAPYVLGSGVFGDESERTGWILDYLHQRGGVCMGMIRFHQHSGLFANENGLDDLYGLRYTLSLLRRDDVERAIVSFYGKLAQGLTRNTFIGAEGTSLIPLDEWGRPMYLPPNSASNAFFLWTLRYMLIQDWDEDDDGKPDTLKLLFATPRHWLNDGANIKVQNAPTAFGRLSLEVASRLKRGEVIVVVSLPDRTPNRCLLRLRLPDGWGIASVRIGRRELKFHPDGTIDLSGLHGRLRVRAKVQKLS